MLPQRSKNSSQSRISLFCSILEHIKRLDERPFPARLSIVPACLRCARYGRNLQTDCDLARIKPVGASTTIPGTLENTLRTGR
jgi:hypothetical protein